MTPITIPTAGMSLGCVGLPSVIARPAARMTVARIQEEVARYYGMPLHEMASRRRMMPFARHRQVAMFLARELTEQSFPMIGRAFGRRDHTTVLHACRAIEAQAFDDQMLRDDLAYLKARLA